MKKELIITASILAFSFGGYAQTAVSTGKTPTETKTETPAATSETESHTTVSNGKDAKIASSSETSGTGSKENATDATTEKTTDQRKKPK